MGTDYSKMTMDALVDLLAEETQKFTHLLTYKQSGKQYEESKKKIHALTAAIADRHRKSNEKKRMNNADPNRS